MTPQRQKEVGLVVFVLAFSVGAFLLTWLFVQQGRFTLTSVLAVLITLAGFWAAVVSFSLGVLQHPGSAAAVVLGVPAALALVGLGQVPALVAALLLIALLASARYLIRNDVVSRVRYRTSEMFTRGARVVIFGVIVIVLGLAWPELGDNLTPAQLRLPVTFVEGIVQLALPALPHGLTGVVDAHQITTLVVNIVNEQLQTVVTTYRSVFTLMVIAAVFFTWKEIVVVIAWPVIRIIAVIVALARRIGLVYISRSQATIEQLHL